MHISQHWCYCNTNENYGRYMLCNGPCSDCNRRCLLHTIGITRGLGGIFGARSVGSSRELNGILRD
ncbi:hypothetical protein LINPERHAP1_LOCUS40549 [Linum perenne]